MFTVYHYIKNQCHKWHDTYGTKYIFVVVAVIVSLNIFVSSLIYLGAEPGVDNWYDAIYWTITTLCTVGYGDITPITVVGKGIAMFNMIIGIALFPMFGGMVVGLIQTIAIRKNEVTNCALLEQSRLNHKQNDEIIKQSEELLILLRKTNG